MLAVILERIKAVNKLLQKEMIESGRQSAEIAVRFCNCFTRDNCIR